MKILQRYHFFSLQNTFAKVWSKLERKNDCSSTAVATAATAGTGGVEIRQRLENVFSCNSHGALLGRNRGILQKVSSARFVGIGQRNRIGRGSRSGGAGVA